MTDVLQFLLFFFYYAWGFLSFVNSFFVCIIKPDCVAVHIGRLTWTLIPVITAAQAVMAGTMTGVMWHSLEPAVTTTSEANRAVDDADHDSDYEKANDGASADNMH